MFKRAYTAAMPDQPAAVVNCLRVRLCLESCSVVCICSVNQSTQWGLLWRQHMYVSVIPSLSRLPVQDVDRWSFDVFALNSTSSDHALQALFFELITRYELNTRFKVCALWRYYKQIQSTIFNIVHIVPPFFFILLILFLLQKWKEKAFSLLSLQFLSQN